MPVAGTRQRGQHPNCGNSWMLRSLGLRGLNHAALPRGATFRAAAEHKGWVKAPLLSAALTNLGDPTPPQVPCAGLVGAGNDPVTVLSRDRSGGEASPYPGGSGSGITFDSQGSDLRTHTRTRAVTAAPPLIKSRGAVPKPTKSGRAGDTWSVLGRTCLAREHVDGQEISTRLRAAQRGGRAAETRSHPCGLC